MRIVSGVVGFTFLFGIVSTLYDPNIGISPLTMIFSFGVGILGLYFAFKKPEKKG